MIDVSKAQKDLMTRMNDQCYRLDVDCFGTREVHPPPSVYELKALHSACVVISETSSHLVIQIHIHSFQA